MMKICHLFLNYQNIVMRKNFLKSLNSFIGLPHRYEIFLKKKNFFINDSKATSFQATNMP